MKKKKKNPTPPNARFVFLSKEIVFSFFTSVCTLNSMKTVAKLEDFPQK